LQSPASKITRVIRAAAPTSASSNPSTTVSPNAKPGPPAFDSPTRKRTEPASFAPLWREPKSPIQTI
jgi:hypothetical protein